MTKKLISLSKKLSHALRHDPGAHGLSVDREGWASVKAVLTQMCVTREELEEVVAWNDKRRFSFSDDGSHIRANQGHSIEVDLGLVSVEPPEVLYHGTAERNITLIQRDGLLKMSRQHVHLSELQETAVSVGTRYGKPVVLTIAARQMHQDGIEFYQAKNGVWLTDYVDPKYIAFSPATTASSPPH